MQYHSNEKQETENDTKENEEKQSNEDIDYELNI